MKTLDKFIYQFLSILAGVFVGLLANAIYSLLPQGDNQVKIRMAIIIMLFIIIIVLIIYLYKVTERIDLIRKYDLHKRYISGVQAAYNVGNSIYTNVPNYLIEMGKYFSKIEVIALNKRNTFSSFEQEILRSRELLD